MSPRAPPPLCPHRAPGAVDAEARQAALAAAEARCRDQGETWTAPRQRTLELLLAADGPRGAYDLIAAYRPGAPVAPPTVYRALQFLSAMGLAHRIEGANGYVACARPGAAHTPAFVICDCCRRVEELAEASTPEILAAARPSNFTVRGVTLEVSGLCATCREGPPHPGPNP